jgi:hypothetical protein
MNHSIVSVLSVLMLGAFFMSGCDLAKPKNENTHNQPAVAEPLPQTEEPPNPPGQNEPVQEDNTVTVKAEVGAGAKGRGYGNYTGNPMDIITVPIAAGFRAKERIAFQYVDHAMNLFKAEHERGPNSHEEFMKEIIQKNGIMLPQLPSGQEYLYDPSDGELKVRKPKDAP